MLYYQTELPSEIEDIILDSPLIEGIAGASRSIVDAVGAMVRQGSMAIYHASPVVFFLRAMSPDVGIVHLAFEPEVSPFAMRRACLEFIAWAREGTGYHRLEGRTSNLRLAVFGMHCGADMEGIRKESFRTPTGMADEYELGYILRSTLPDN